MARLAIVLPSPIQDFSSTPNFTLLKHVLRQQQQQHTCKPKKAPPFLRSDVHADLVLPRKLDRKQQQHDALKRYDDVSKPVPDRTNLRKPKQRRLRGFLRLRGAGRPLDAHGNAPPRRPIHQPDCLCSRYHRATVSLSLHISVDWGKICDLLALGLDTAASPTFLISLIRLSETIRSIPLSLLR